MVEPGVKVRFHDQDGEDELYLVEPYEADAAHGRVSTESPLGRALLGHAAGEVRFRAAGCLRVVTILGVHE